MALVLSQPLTLRAEGEATTNKPLPFHITPQALENVLDQFIAATDWQVGYSPALAQGKSSSGVIGNFTPQQALTKLLAGTGLSYRVSRNNTVTVEKAAANPFVPVANPKTLEPSSETTLEKVTVEADSAYDPEYYADPYNKDYVIPNATAGTKTDTPIMETPLNVQVISKQVLKDQQAINLGQALKNVSGVTINASAGGDNNAGGGLFQNLILRGFTSATFFRNGFRLQDGSANREMANVESVEVLKGAAAILYGQVEPGGMVNVITKQPLAMPYYGFNQQFGSYDLYRTTFDATGPIANNKDVLYRMNMSYENSGSFRDFVGKEDVFLAPVLKWNISPRTQVTFEMEYNYQHLGLDVAGFAPLLNGKLFNMPRSRNYSEYSPGGVETVFGGFNWSHQFNDDWSLKHRFSVNQNQSFRNPVYPFQVGNTKVDRILFSGSGQGNTYSTNIDLTGHFDTVGLKHTLLLGGDYYRLDSTFDQSFNPSDPASTIDILHPVHPGSPFSQHPLQFYYHNTMNVDQYGLYVQDQIKLPYNVHVMGGIRYQYIHQTGSNTFATDGLTIDNPITQDAVTPRVGILWQPQSWLSLYANYVESFGANSGITFPDRKVVPPTSAEQYEGGIKTEFFGGKLRATLAYFDLTKTNITATDKAHSRFGNFVVVTGAIRSRGPELDIQGEILPGWNVIANWSNTDIRVTKTNPENDPDVSGYSIGSRLFNVPRNTGSLWSTYEVQEGDLKGLKFGGGVTLRDGQVACCDLPQFKLPGYTTVDLLAAYSRDIGNTKITAQLNVNNLLDKHYFTGIQTSGANSPGFQTGYADFGQPRTFMGSINIQY
ncbi:MAG: TonB-dependent receptor [Methyloglobulus sp.]|nr:TonB-dependent receptor [Methyloglobulus sp.]